MGCCNSSNSDKIFYIGPTLSCIGVETNDNLSIVLQKINEGVCNSGGGGGNQDLQSVIDNGGHVTSTINPNTYIDFLNDNIGISFTTADGEVGNPDNSSLFLQEPTNIVLQNKYFPSNYLSSLTLAGGKFTLVETLDTSSTVLVFEDHTEEGEVLLQFPAKPEGTYTLATLDDITAATNLQSVLTNGFISDKSILLNGVNSGVTVTNGIDGLARLGSGEVYISNTGSAKQLVITPEGAFRKIDTTGVVKNSLFLLPLKDIDSTYTLATESAISGTFANPTSITVVNGIITAIS